MKLRHGTIALANGALFTLALGCTPKTDSTLAPAPSSSSGASVAPSAQAALSAPKGLGGRFPDFGFMVSPAEYQAKYAGEPVFRLKTYFPS